MKYIFRWWNVIIRRLKCLFFWKWGPWEKDEVEAFLFFFQSPLLVDMTWSQVSDNSAISREKRWRRRSFEFEPINILPTVHNLASKFYTTYNCPREKHELVWTKLFKLLSVPSLFQKVNNFISKLYSFCSKHGMLQKIPYPFRWSRTIWSTSHFDQWCYEIRSHIVSVELFHTKIFQVFLKASHRFSKLLMRFCCKFFSSVWKWKGSSSQ